MITGERSGTAAKEKLGNFETFVKNTMIFMVTHNQRRSTPSTASAACDGVERRRTALATAYDGVRRRSTALVVGGDLCK